MKYLTLLLVALVAVGCGDDPLAPSPEPVAPSPPPAQAFCTVTTPGHEGFWIVVDGRGAIWVPPSGPTYTAVPCE
jgi:hypothetical protein